MKQFAEFFSIAAFLGAYIWTKDIYFSTTVLMGITLIQLLVLKLTKHAITPMQWAMASMVIIFGGLTLWFRDERFIKIKPTIVYLITAATFLISNSVFKNNLVKTALGSALTPPESTWDILNKLWIIMFISMAVLNLVLAYTLSTELWAWSKMGFVFLTMLFVVGQFYTLRAYLKQ
jgi:intracellular septation protein